MSSATINLARARELLRKAVEQKGADFVYLTEELRKAGVTGCYNIPLQEVRDLQDNSIPVRENDPRETTGCLIGTALDIAGETRHHTSIYCGVSVGSLWNDLLTNLASSYLSLAQQEQDHGATWGVAMAEAEKWLRDQWDENYPYGYANRDSIRAEGVDLDGEQGSTSAD